MTDTAEASTGPVPTKGWKKGLPRVGLKTAEEAAAKLWESARRSSCATDVFAKALGLTAASGSQWDLKLALLRGYKLIEFKDEQIALSPLGQRLINGADKQQQIAARREALQNLKAYKELIDTFVGTPLPTKESLATTLEYEYGKGRAVAEMSAQAFLNSLTFAQMVSPSGRVTLDGTDAATKPTRDSIVEKEDERAAEELDAAEEEIEAEEEIAASLDEVEDFAHDEEMVVLRHAAGGISLAVTLDLSQFRADEVIQILRELGLAKRR
jgi:hypothetical protein